MKFSIKAIILWQLSILLITLISSFFIPYREDNLGGWTQAYKEAPFLYSRANFDGNHYIYISERGYGYGQRAFFPLYPKLIDAISKIFSNRALAGVIISLTSFSIGLCVLFKIVEKEWDKNIAKWTVVSILIFPTSFYFSFVYTEGLFFMLVVLGFYFARKQQFVIASLIAALAGYARLAGIFLLPAFVIEVFSGYRKYKKFSLQSFALVLIPFGLLTYMYQLQNVYGDALGFIHDQKLFGQSRSQTPIAVVQVFWRYLKIIFNNLRNTYTFISTLLEFFSAAFAIFISIVSLFKIRMSYIVFSVFAFLLPALSGTFASMPRYIIVCFGIFIYLGIFLSSSNSRLKISFVIVSGLLFIISTILFVRGYWIA